MFAVDTAGMIVHTDREMKHVKIINESSYPLDEVMPIMRAAYQVVKPEINTPPARPLPVTLEHTRSRTWMCKWNRNAGGNTARLLFAKPGNKSIDTGIGGIELCSMTEVMLAVSAWTFAAVLCRPALGAHCAREALRVYRCNPAEIDGAIASAVQAKKDKASEAFAKKVFDGFEQSRLEYKLGKLEQKEQVWQRKLKLATTKIKSLRRKKAALRAAETRRQRKLEELPPSTPETQ